MGGYFPQPEACGVSAVGVNSHFPLILRPGPPCRHRTLPTNLCASQAPTKQVMLYWLQQLQMKRWEFHSGPPAPPTAPDTTPARNGPALHIELGNPRVGLLLHTRAVVARPLPCCWERVGRVLCKGSREQGWSLY